MYGHRDGLPVTYDIIIEAKVCQSSVLKCCSVHYSAVNMLISVQLVMCGCHQGLPSLHPTSEHHPHWDSKKACSNEGNAMKY